MYQPINGFTKAKILEVLRARKFDSASVTSGCTYTCAYKGLEGNRCAVGMFIPDGHDGEEFEGPADSLLARYQDLKPLMPLEISGLNNLQLIHDRESRGNIQPFQGNAKAAMIDWVEKNVQDDAA